MNTMRSPQQSIFKGLEGNNKDNVSGNDIIQATSEGYEDIQPKKKKKDYGEMWWLSEGL